MAKFEGWSEAPGKFGPFLRVMFDGRSYAVFNKDDFAFVKSLKLGDEVSFEAQKKGNFENIVRFEGRAPAGASAPPSSGGAAPSPKSSFKRDPEEFNYMMATSYAKDFIIGSGFENNSFNMAPEDAVKLVVDLFRSVSEVHKEGRDKAAA